MSDDYRYRNERDRWGRGEDQRERGRFEERDRGGDYGRGYGGESHAGSGRTDWNRESWSRQDAGRDPYGRDPYGRDNDREDRYGYGRGEDMSHGGVYGDRRYAGRDQNRDYGRDYGRGGGSSFGGGSPYSGGSSGRERNEGQGDWRGRDEGGRDRGFFQRAGDEMASWFGDRDAERRRDMDARRDEENARHRGRGPRGYTRSDDRIREDVHDRLTDDPYVDASDIEVEVKGGEVTLTGRVDSRQVKRRAEDIAEAVSGVSHVQNNLRVQQAGVGASTGAGASAMAGLGGMGAGAGSAGGTAGTTGTGGIAGTSTAGTSGLAAAASGTRNTERT